MIDAIHWEGDQDGTLVLEYRRDSSAHRERLVYDRPGDALLALQQHAFPNEEKRAAAAAYGVCLALRGVENSHFIAQIAAKAIQFMAGADPASVHLYRAMEELRRLVLEHGAGDGHALCTRLHDAARRFASNS